MEYYIIGLFGFTIILLLIVILVLKADKKFVNELNNDLDAQYKRVVGHLNDTIDKWNMTIENNKNIVNLNSQLLDHIDSLEERITLLEEQIKND